MNEQAYFEQFSGEDKSQTSYKFPPHVGEMKQIHESVAQFLRDNPHWDDANRSNMFVTKDGILRIERRDA